jgi:PAS domain-containing protein
MGKSRYAWLRMAVAVREPKSLTLILARGFASNLSMPISVHDPTGRVVFYNESAEAVFGLKFAETGELSAAEWTSRVSPEEADGTSIPLEELPVGVALRERRPAHRRVHFTDPHSSRYAAEVTAFPLMGREEELVGAVRIFWNEAVAAARAQVSGMRSEEAAGQERVPRRGRPKSLVLLLAREFASNLATPIYVTDSESTLVYFNEPAERIGGRSFAEAAEMSIRQWAELLRLRNVDGTSLPLREMPGGIAFIEWRPAHARLRLTGLDGAERVVSTTAFPLFGADESFHGIMVIFWEEE